MASGARNSRKRKKKKISLIIMIIVVVAIAACLAVVGGIYMVNRNRTGFLKDTTLNGKDITGMTAAEAADEVSADFKNPEVEVTEDGKTVLQGTLDQFGYTFDKDKLTNSLNEELERQKGSVSSVFNCLLYGDSISIDAAYAFDEDTFDKAVNGAALSVPRVESKDATVELNKDTNKYEVVAAVQGNEVDDAKLQAAVKQAIDTATTSGDLDDPITVAIPDDAYTSKKVSTDTSSLEAEAQKKNKELSLQEYKNMVITYTFGDETEQLTSDTFMNWMTIGDDGSVTIDQKQVAAYVSDLANKYNTRHLDRSFTTTGGQTITIPASHNEYGYTIDEDAETKQLTADLQGKQSVTREPEYVQTNDYGNPYYFGRNGTDDLAGSYVEVDLTKQHVWLYSNGSLVVESDLVSGNLSKNQGTMTGAFPLAYKESPSTLTGPGYTTEVQYWMPFYEGEGLHDANWRSAFGGDIYKTNGSNGCLNLPPTVAQTIFENVDAGYPIIIYYEPGTEPDASTYASDARNVADNPADFAG